MNPQGLQFPSGFPQAQQQNFNVGNQPNAASVASGQMGMPAVGESSNMGAQLQNAAQIVQWKFARRFDLICNEIGHRLGQPRAWKSALSTPVARLHLRLVRQPAASVGLGLFASRPNRSSIISHAPSVFFPAETLLAILRVPHSLLSLQLQLAVASTRCPRRRAPLAPSGKQTLPPSSSLPASLGGAHDAALSSGVTTTVSIRGNIAALQRQWAVISGQPDGPTKTNAQQHLAAQLKRLQMMEQSAIQSMGAHIPPGAQLNQQQQPTQMGIQPQQQQQQQQQNALMQGLNPAQLVQMQSQQGMNGLGMDPNFGASQQNDMSQLQQQQQQQQQQQPQQPPFGQPGTQAQQMPTPQTQSQQPGFNPAQVSGPSQSAQPAGGAPGMGAAGGAKRDFVGTVRNFMQQRGTPFPPQLSLSFVGPASSNLPGDTKTIELQALFAAVIHSGGSQRAAQIPGFWAVIASRLGLKVGPPDGTQSAPDAVPSPGEVPDRLSAFYRDRLSAFEQFWMSRMPQRQPSGQSAAAGSPAASGPNAGAADPNMQAARTQQSTNAQSQQMQQQPGQPPQNSQQQPQTPSQQQQPQQQQQQQQQQGGQHGKPAAANQPGAPGQITPANLPANLHQQMLQLQQLVSSGRITSQQARERFVAMQQATRQMMVKQQQQQQQQQASQAGPSSDPSQGQQQQQQPQQQQQGPPAMQNGPQGFTGMPQMPQTQPSPAPAQRSTPGQASPAPNQGLPGTMPGAAPGLFSDPAAMLAQQQQQQQFQQHAQSAGHAGADGVPAWPSQAPTGMPPSPTKPQAVNGAGPKTPIAAVKPDPKQSKKKRKKTESGMPTPLPTGVGADVKPPMPQLADQASGPGAIGQPPVGMPTASPAPPTQAEKQVIPGTSQPVGPPAPPQKHKIEYLPLRRDVQTHGGWDLTLAESQFAPAMVSRGRPRTLRELGLVDVQGLIMSLRSRLDYEVSYALNTLLILSAGVGAAPNFQFGLASCEDLLEELLDLLEETSFQGKPEVVAEHSLDSMLRSRNGSNGESSLRPTKRSRREGDLESLPTYRDWIAAAAEEEAELKIWRRRKAARSRSTAGSVLNGGSEVDSVAGLSSAASSSLDALDATISTNGVESEQERSTEQRAVTALTILTIIKNFSVMPENMYFFNHTPKLLQVLARLCRGDAERARAAHDGEVERDAEADGDDETVFTTMEALRVRKEVLVIVSNLAGEALTLRDQSVETVKTLFELLASFILESGEVEEMDHAAEIAELAATLPPGAPAPPVIRRIPYHADLALDALSKLALPDDNREVLGSMISGCSLEGLVSEMVRMLPMTESDFKVLNTEHRLGYCERLSMCLYNLAFLAPPDVKLRLRAIPGLSGIVLRIVKKLSRATPEFSRNPFSVLCRRLVEALRLISDGNDMFGAPALLGFGFGEGAAAAAAVGGKRQIGLLLGEEEGVVEILGTNELDAVLGDELFALIASG
ncbi:ARID domain-containing protein [Pseudozyma hubeiensis]|nr:ARID domain-containing protein [Pseudozyma hubeiensis]